MHGLHPIRPDLAGQAGFACVKAHKRLFIQDLASGALLYSHPDFIELRNRELMQALAAAANARGALHVIDITAFETLAPRRRSNRRAGDRDFSDLQAVFGGDPIVRRFFPALFPTQSLEASDDAA